MLYFHSDIFFEPFQAEYSKHFHSSAHISVIGSNCSISFQIPANSPCSVTLQPANGDTGKPCGVDYELKTYVGDEPEEKLHKR